MLAKNPKRKQKLLRRYDDPQYKNDEHESKLERERYTSEKKRLAAIEKEEKEKQLKQERARAKEEKAKQKEAQAEERAIKMAEQREIKNSLNAEEMQAKLAERKARAEEVKRLQAEQEQQARKERLANAQNYAPRVPLSADQIPQNVLYAPGEEPDKIKVRIDSLFQKMDAEYPDHVLRNLKRDHDSWSDTASEIAKVLGYENKNVFLTAYGYTVEINVGGRRVTVDPQATIAELKQRYPDGVFKNMELLQKANMDLPIKTLVNNARKLWGVSLAQHLADIGLLKNS